MTKGKRNFRRNLDPSAATYGKGQAKEHFIPFVPAVPDWIINCGPGSSVEFREMRKAWPKAKLIGLEPSDAGYAAAKARWPEDGILLQVAVWDKDGAIINLYYPDDLLHSTCYATGERHLRDDTDSGGLDDVATVYARSLDSLDLEYGPFTNAVVWADIEGAERRMLRGCRELLARGAIIAFNLEVRPQTEPEITRVLRSYGYRKEREYLACEQYRDEVWLKERLL